MACVPILLWLAIATATAMIDDQQYCSVRYRRLCQGKGSHVACLFPTPGPGESCRNYTRIVFTHDLKHFVTNYINRRRQRVAAGNERVRGGVRLPKPSIMMQVKWDRELALLAQRLADQCTFVHDDCRATLRYPYAGQTVGEVKWRRSSDSDELSAQRAIRRVLDAWWGERRRVKPHQLTTPFRLTSRGTTWGHFSQLAVWTLRAVGCGAVRHGVDHIKLLLVCDFSHTNMLGQRTIAPGPLAQCPLHTVRKSRSSYPLLCASVGINHQPPSHDEHSVSEYDDYTEEGETATAVTFKLTSGKQGVIFKEEGKPPPPDMYKKYGDDKLTRYPHQYDDYDEAVADPVRKKLSKDQIIKKLQSELEIRRGGKIKSQSSLHPPMELWRGDPNMPANAVNRKVWRYSTVSDLGHSRIALNYRQSSRTLLPQEQRQHEPVRHKWKQTRDRPQRPGANALLFLKPPEKPHQAAKVSAASLKLDKDVEDQLFLDTGFKPQWRKQSQST